MDVISGRLFTAAAAMALVACSGAAPRPPHERVPPALSPLGPPAEIAQVPDTPAPKRLAIDWNAASAASDEEVRALWNLIAPTGADWEEKLDEIPDGAIADRLALVLLADGNFRCLPPKPPSSCPAGPIDVPDPAPDATLADPCLRRVLAMWAIDQLSGETLLPQTRDALRAIAAIPPPESLLVAVALAALPETDQAGNLELRAIAFGAGHRELVNSKLVGLDEAHLSLAITRHHIDGALAVLPAETYRSVYLAAITDEKLHRSARVDAILELDGLADNLPADVRAALIAARRSPDCTVAAQAARVLVSHGDTRAGPGRPRARKPVDLMRAICVLASFESLQRADEPSYLLGYVPRRGLEVVTIIRDPYSETDDDGDGDPHTVRTTTVVPRDEVVLPELEDMVRALRSCAGTTCTSDEREFRFTIKGAPGELLLTRIEVVDRPPCK